MRLNKEADRAPHSTTLTCDCWLVRGVPPGRWVQQAGRGHLPRPRHPPLHPSTCETPATLPCSTLVTSHKSQVTESEPHATLRSIRYL